MTSVSIHKQSCSHDHSLKEQNSTKVSPTAHDAIVDYFGDKLRLTTFTNESDINAIPLNWNASTPLERGPIVVSKYKDGMTKHNSIGAHAGPYSIYHALSIASKQLDLNHEPDYTNAHPPFNFPQQPQWSTPGKIVSMDPFGHLSPWIFNDVAKKENVQIKPTMSITKAVLSIPEIKDEVKNGNLIPDGKIVLNNEGEMACTKIAIDPVWYLPGVAERLNISESELRKALFEDTNGMYPELISRPDIKTFCPPIGGITAYIFGDPSNLPKEDKRLALRIHDECSGSDVFLSDICSCRCYLIFGLVEAAKEAQNGGNGLVCYFRKEGRCLGEVTKYLVYNARKRGGDTADEYFHRTECIAGVKDARFQELMPDILHWLGITKIDRMLSMSNMKHDAIVDSGISIDERVEIPDHLLPADSRVEIDAKIAAGYFTNGHIYTTEELKKVEGRKWEGL
jgi:GTP cyclohydrolase II